jgi:hypothetical protein
MGVYPAAQHWEHSVRYDTKHGLACGGGVSFMLNGLADHREDARRSHSGLLFGYISLGVVICLFHLFIAFKNCRNFAFMVGISWS